MAIEITPADYLPGEGSGETDYQQQADMYQAQSFENASRNLAARAADRSGISDNYAGEAQLLQLQQELSQAHNRGDHVLALQLDAQVTQLAAELVGAAPASEAPAYNDNAMDAQDYATQRAEDDPALVEALNNAASFLDEEVAGQINEFLASDDVAEVAMAADAAKQIRPEMIAGADMQPNPNGFDDSVHNYFVEIAGEETANDIRLLTAALATGKVSKAGAMRTAMKSQAHLSAMLQAAADPNVAFYLNL